MKTSVITKDHQIQTQERPVPSIGPGDILLKVQACGVCGTDVGKYKFKLTQGDIVLGHEVAGEVVNVGANVDRFKVGDRVVVAHHTPCYTCHFCRHESYSMCKLFKSSNLEPGGFSEYLRIPSLHVRLTAHAIPTQLSFEEAIFMEPLACILRNIKRAKLQRGDTVLVIGLGTMGLLTAQSLQAQGVHVIGSDLRSDRQDIARSLNLKAVVSGQTDEVMAACKQFTDQRGVDCVILTSGNDAVYSRSLAYVRDGGCVSIFAGLEPGKKLQLDINEFYKREVTYFSSYSPSPLELIEALEYLADKTVNVSVLNPKSYALDELSLALDEAAEQKVFKAIITPHTLKS